MSRIRCAMACACLLLCGAATEPGGEKYAIKLERPSKVGDARDVHLLLDFTQNSEETNPGQAPTERRATFTGDLSGRLDVTGVDEHGQETGFTITVDKFVTGKPEQEELPAGSVIDVKRTAKELTFKLKGDGNIGMGANQFLRLSYPPRDQVYVSDDESAGTAVPQPVGGSWSASADAAAKIAAGEGIKLDVKQTTTTGTLLGVEAVNGVRVMKVRVSHSSKNAATTDPGGAGNESVDAEETGTEVLPVDPLLPVASSDMEATIRETASDSGGGARTVETIKVHLQTLNTPVKAGAK